jgi:phage recombination protein Bet
MSKTNVVLYNQQYPMAAARGIPEATFSALANSVYPGAKEESIIMAVDYCTTRGLDVMLKPVHIVPMSVKDSKTGQFNFRDVIMPGIGLYRIQADRSGNYAGADDPEFGPEITQVFAGKNGQVSVTFPQWCSVTVYKMIGGQRVAFKAKEYWLENYATAGKDSNAPNAMWSKRPYGQLAKCSEAQALRKAWPEVGQDATAEEMEGKSLEIDITPAPAPQRTIASSVDKLKAKPAAQAAPVDFGDSEPSRVEQLLIQLSECQTAHDVNQWGNTAAAEYPQGTPEYDQLVAEYNNRLAQVSA